MSSGPAHEARIESMKLGLAGLPIPVTFFGATNWRVMSALAPELCAGVDGFGEIESQPPRSLGLNLARSDAGAQLVDEIGLGLVAEVAGLSEQRGELLRQWRHRAGWS